MTEKYSKSLFIFLPAIAMMLGWGLRGHIGGGPFGAMIPGAMLALAICLLLKLPASVTSIVVVFGLAAWKSRFAIKNYFQMENLVEETEIPLVKEFGILLAVALFTHWFFPNLLEPFVKAGSAADSFGLSIIRGIARVLVNYAFYGFIFVLVILRFPRVAWQLGITLTFCHAAIDLVRDFYPDLNPWTPLTMHFFLVFLMTAVVALLTVYFSRRENSVVNLLIKNLCNN